MLSSCSKVRDGKKEMLRSKDDAVIWFSPARKKKIAQPVHSSSRIRNF